MSAPPLQVLLDPVFNWIEAHSLIEGLLALIAALFAIALRRQTRIFKAPGFIMLSIGLIIDMTLPHAMALPLWTTAWRGVALTVALFGVTRLAIEGSVVAVRGRKAELPTFVADFALLAIYAVIGLAVMRFMLGVDPRVLLAVPAAGTILWGLIQQSNFFHGVLLQSRRPCVPGDWVRLGDVVGKVEGTGWRATRVITRANENIQIPNSVLTREMLVNYSGPGGVADEIFVGLGYETAPERVEETVHTVLRDIPEIRSSEVDVWEYGEWAIRYRIRFWLSDYSAQERVRSRVTRSLWYAFRRNSIEIPLPTRRIFTHDGAAQRIEAGTQQDMIAELRRVYLLDALSPEQLDVLLPMIRVRQFGRGEVLMREGEIGDSFYVLRKGKLEVVARSQDRGKEERVREIDAASAENYVGEIALLTGEARSATVRAVSDVEVLELNRDGFTKLFRSNPEVAATLADIAERRLAETRRRTAEIHPHAAPRPAGNAVLAAMRKVFDF
ncbi:MAG TPA: mechanosensitive ion channel family protein [Candidatus Binataceae bacterium]|nr:mechanosensitive ion channel family protein [Candidatus Binataceae bacterium]